MCCPRISSLPELVITRFVLLMPGLCRKRFFFCFIAERLSLGTYRPVVLLVSVVMRAGDCYDSLEKSNFFVLAASEPVAFNDFLRAVPILPPELG